MSKMFTDENGAQWEEPLDNGVPANPTYRIIRPVKQPEWEVKLETDRMIPPEYWINISFLDIKEDQAQLIKECVERLMKYLTMPKPADFEHSFWPHIIQEARHSIKGGE